MNFSADYYFHAGLERMRQARVMYSDGESYALAMYLAGLAVECVLRAFRWKENPVFEGRHDLLQLFKESGLLRLNEDQLRARGLSADEIIAQVGNLSGPMNTVAILWTNDLRFAPESLLRLRLVKSRRYRRQKGDIRKAAALELQNAAQDVINRGTFLWHWSKK